MPRGRNHYMLTCHSFSFHRKNSLSPPPLFIIHLLTPFTHSLNFPYRALAGKGKIPIDSQPASPEKNVYEHEQHLVTHSKGCADIHWCGLHGRGAETLSSSGRRRRHLPCPFSLELRRLLAQTSVSLHNHQLHHHQHRRLLQAPPETRRFDAGDGAGAGEGLSRDDSKDIRTN